MVAIIMGSDSDLPVMRDAADFLKKVGIDFELTVVSAHRTPERMFDFATKAHERGLKVIIAGAGGAAHLPGMVASLTPLPVIGVPIKSSNSIDGWDSILSILQMPNGLAAQIIGASDKVVQQKMSDYMVELKDAVKAKYERLEKEGYENYKK